MDEPSSPEANAITLRIKFKSASLDEFVARYGADVSAGGIFIRTKQPLAVGALLRFDFSLVDGSLLLAGLGTVVWVREPDPSRVGSIPGMGLRFDQLAPESQQIHQQILAAKAGRAAGSPAPNALAVPAARPAPRPETPPPAAPRPAPAPLVVAPPVRAETSDRFDEFASGGKTEIADKPPSFYFDALDSARGGAAGARQEAAPVAPLEDTVTDSQAPAAADSSWSGPIDISEDASEAVTATGAKVALKEAADSGQAKRMGDKPARETFDLPPLDLAKPAPVAEVPPALEAPPARSSSGAVKIPTGQGWLDRAMDMPEAEGGTPVEAPAEHTEEMAAPPQEPLAEVPVAASGETERPALQEPEIFDPEGSDEKIQKPAGQGKKLVVVGIIAAGLAFAGVYLLQAKPWQRPAAPAPQPASEVEQPVPVVAPAVPKAAEPIQPSAQPTPPAPAPEPVKPAEKAAPPQPSKETVNANPKAAEAAKPAETVEAAKRPVPAAGPAKKTAGKPVLAPMPTSPALAAGQDDSVYLLKLRSVPPGAQITIDGEPMGQTPFQRRILDVDKNHTVTIRKHGYEPYEHIVTPGDGWEKDGNTEILKIVAKLRKSNGESASPAAAPEAQPEAAPEKL